MAIESFLAEVPLFADLSPADLGTIAQRLRRRRYKEGETIFRKNEPGVALYIIVSGKIKIHIESPDGTDRIIAIFSSGEFFGELAVIDGEERSADASTLEPTELLMLTKEDLHDAIRRNPQISLHLLTTLAGRVRRTTEAYQAHSTLDVNGRLAMQLIRLAEQHGTVTASGIRVGLRLTQSDLGALVGASRESVNKVLGFFRRQGYVSVDDKNEITILNQQALSRMCDLSF